MKKPSLLDIARELGVSTTLVSLVLNGKAKESRIGEDIAKKVIELAEQRKYKPNKLARGLRTGKTETLALIVADISNVFFSKLARVVEDEAEKAGYRVMFGSSDERPDKLGEMVRIFQERKVDGFIISPTIGSQPFIQDLKKNHIPFVLIDRRFQNNKSNFVGVDNYKASSEAVNHLLSFGYSRIGTLTIMPELTQMKDRLEGYRDALKSKGFRYEKKYVGVVDYSQFRDSVFKEVHRLLEPPLSVRALFFQTCTMGITGLECIRQMNLRIPLDIAVVSFDDPVEYKLFDPPVTAIKQPVENIGKNAVRIIVNQLNRKSTEYEHKILPTEFIIRRSCGNLSYT